MVQVLGVLQGEEAWEDEAGERKVSIVKFLVSIKGFVWERSFFSSDGFAAVMLNYGVKPFCLAPYFSVESIKDFL